MNIFWGGLLFSLPQGGSLPWESELQQNDEVVHVEGSHGVGYQNPHKMRRKST